MDYSTKRIKKHSSGDKIHTKSRSSPRGAEEEGGERVSGRFKATGVLCHALNLPPVFLCMLNHLKRTHLLILADLRTPVGEICHRVHTHSDFSEGMKNLITFRIKEWSNTLTTSIIFLSKSLFIFVYLK